MLHPSSHHLLPTTFFPPPSSHHLLPTPPQADTPLKLRDWGLLSASTSCLRELLGVLDAAGRGRNKEDKAAAEALARR
jgi:hypothetical protein